MARRVNSYEEVLDKGEGKGKGKYLKWNEIYLDIAVDEGDAPKEYILRLVGYPISFLTYRDSKYKRDADGEILTDAKGNRIQKRVPFPDADFNKSFRRISTEDDPKYGACPWKAMDYISQKRYAINCIVIDADTETKEVRVIDAPASLFEKFAEMEKANKDKNAKLVAAGKKPKFWTLAGGEVAPTFFLKITYDTKTWGNRKYEVSTYDDPAALSEEDEELLKATNRDGRTITQEDVNRIYEEDPDLQNYPIWFTYGHDLAKLFEPDAKVLTAPKYQKKNAQADTGDENAKSHEKADLAINMGGDAAGSEDEDDAPPAFAAPRRGSAAKVPVSATPASAYDDDDEEAPIAPPRSTGRSASRPSVPAVSDEDDEDEEAVPVWSRNK